MNRGMATGWNRRESNANRVPASSRWVREQVELAPTSAAPFYRAQPGARARPRTALRRMRWLADELSHFAGKWWPIHVQLRGPTISAPPRIADIFWAYCTSVMTIIEIESHGQ